MISVRELRIGNLFILPNGEYGKISYHEIRLLIVGANKPYYQPVIIADEILLKCGFSNRTEFSENYYSFQINSGKYFGLLRNVDSSYSLCDCDIDTEIKHLHQLQNLYFALTGHELEINL